MCVCVRVALLVYSRFTSGLFQLFCAENRVYYKSDACLVKEDKDGAETCQR